MASGVILLDPNSLCDVPPCLSKFTRPKIVYGGHNFFNQEQTIDGLGYIEQFPFQSVSRTITRISLGRNLFCKHSSANFSAKPRASKVFIPRTSDCWKENKFVDVVFAFYCTLGRLFSKSKVNMDISLCYVKPFLIHMHPIHKIIVLLQIMSHWAWKYCCSSV